MPVQQRGNDQAIENLTTLTIPCFSMDRCVSMDFIIGIPKLGNKPVIMVVVDRFSKYAHFCALPHPFTPTSVAQFFLDQIFKPHGVPTSIVSDRNPTFTNKFLQELFNLQAT